MAVLRFSGMLNIIPCRRQRWFDETYVVVVDEDGGITGKAGDILEVYDAVSVLLTQKLHKEILTIIQM